jgi:hypothetical protein
VRSPSALRDLHRRYLALLEHRRQLPRRRGEWPQFLTDLDDALAVLEGIFDDYNRRKDWLR